MIINKKRKNARLKFGRNLFFICITFFFAINFSLPKQQCFYFQNNVYSPAKLPYYEQRRYCKIMKALDYIVLVLVIIGAVNWGLVGFFGLDLVAFLFGSMSILSRIVYAIIGICGLYAISYCGRISN